MEIPTLKLPEVDQFRLSGTGEFPAREIELETSENPDKMDYASGIMPRGSAYARFSR